MYDGFIYGRGIPLGVIRILEEMETVSAMVRPLLPCLFKKRGPRRGAIDEQEMNYNQFKNNENVAFLSSSLNNILVCSILKGVTSSMQKYKRNPKLVTVKEKAGEKYEHYFLDIELIDPRLFETILVDKATGEVDAETVFELLSSASHNRSNASGYSKGGAHLRTTFAEMPGQKLSHYGRGAQARMEQLIKQGDRESASVRWNVRNNLIEKH